MTHAAVPGGTVATAAPGCGTVFSPAGADPTVTVFVEAIVTVLWAAVLAVIAAFFCAAAGAFTAAGGVVGMVAAAEEVQFVAASWTRFCVYPSTIP